MIKLCAFADEADEDLQGQINALHRHNIHYVELRGINGTNVSKITCEQAKEYAAELARNGIQVWSIGSPIGKVDIELDFQEHMDKLRHVCQIANIFGADRIRMFSFYNAFEKEAVVLERLNQMVQLAAGYGVALCHENEKKIFGDTLERNLKLLEQVPGLRYIYDPANFLEVGEDPNATMPALHCKADYFHIKDFISETRELVPAGHGDGQIARLLDMIGNEDKVLTLEPHLKVFEGYSEFDSTEMNNKYTFPDNNAAFDAAVVALKELLAQQGYKEVDGGYVKGA